MDQILLQAKSTARLIEERSSLIPQLALITGTGLSHVLDDMKIIDRFSYSSLPGFVYPTVSSHRGSLLIGQWEEEDLLVLTGRSHRYEGLSMGEITFPVRVLHELGIRQIIMCNVAGGIHPKYRAGDIIFVQDHIYLMGQHPLIGSSATSCIDVSKVYDMQLLRSGVEFCAHNSIPHGMGTYACLSGPSLETPAEYKYLYTLGADLVGMSTIPELLVAAQLQMKVTVLSIVSNLCYPLGRIDKTTIEEVIQVAEAALPNLRLVLGHLVGVAGRS